MLWMQPIALGKGLKHKTESLRLVTSCTAFALFFDYKLAGSALSAWGQV